MKKGSSTKKWAVHPNPLEDELLTSWIIRLALSNGCSPIDFCKSVFPHYDFRGKDFDLLYNSEFFDVLRWGTGISIDNIFQTSLLPLAHILDSFYRPVNYRPPEKYILPEGINYRITTWIIPINLKLKKNSPGLQYCPQCLLEDKIPYFRREWRLSFITLCQKHHLLLLDQCLNCNQPVQLRLSDYSSKFDKRSLVLTVCNFCGADLRGAYKFPLLKETDSKAIDFQISLVQSLKSKFVILPKTSHIYTNLFFPVLHKLARLLTTESFSEINRRLVQEYFDAINCELSFPHQLKCFEALSTTERYIVMEMIRVLLEDFPINFVSFCKDNFNFFYGELYENLDGRIEWTGPLLNGFYSIPYWYFNVVCGNLIAQSWRYENIKDVLERTPVNSPIWNINKLKDGTFYVKRHKLLKSQKYISPISKSFDRIYARELVSYWEKVLTWRSEDYSENYFW